MGCGGSKFGAEGEAVPVRVRPLLRRRIEEIKTRRNANGLKDSTPSKKVLLHNDDDDAGEEDGDNNSSPPHFIHDDGRKSVSSPDLDKIFEEHVEKEMSLKPEKEESKTGDNEKTEEVKSIADSEEDEDDDDEEGEYDEEGILSNDEGYFCPASPSFRVYCVESLANSNDNDDDSKNEGTIKESSQGDESIASKDSTEGSVTKIRKKGKKGRRIRRVIHKGGHVAVKNLLSVKSCYNPAASSHDNAHLLQKAAA